MDLGKWNSNGTLWKDGTHAIALAESFFTIIRRKSIVQTPTFGNLFSWRRKHGYRTNKPSKENNVFGVPWEKMHLHQQNHANSIPRWTWVLMMKCEGILSDQELGKFWLKVIEGNAAPLTLARWLLCDSLCSMSVKLLIHVMSCHLKSW